MNTKIMKLSEIKPATYNPRKVLKPGDTQFEALVKSIDKFELVEPLIVNSTTGNLVGGHQRLNVLKYLKRSEAEVVIVELSPENEKLLNIALNKIEGDWDYAKLEALFAEFTEDEIAFTGFSEEELVNLFGEATVKNGFVYEDTEEEEEPKSDKSVTDDKPKKTEFNIFLSFPSKEIAEGWLKREGVDEEFTGTSRNITIRMEGAEYGTRC